MLLIGYGKRGGAILPVIVMTTRSPDAAREVAVDIRSKPDNDVLFFELERDGRSAPLNMTA